MGNSIKCKVISDGKLGKNSRGSPFIEARCMRWRKQSSPHPFPEPSHQLLQIDAIEADFVSVAPRLLQVEKPGVQLRWLKGGEIPVERFAEFFVPALRKLCLDLQDGESHQAGQGPGGPCGNAPGRPGPPQPTENRYLCRNFANCRIKCTRITVRKIGSELAQLSRRLCRNCAIRTRN